MSKFCFCSVFFLTIVFGFLLLSPQSENTKWDKSDFLRIHIRANSNELQDQNIKYIVKNKIVEDMNSTLAQSKTKKEAIDNISKNLTQIVQTANDVLAQNGFEYKATAKITAESFPTRAYDNLVLDAGVYDALIIELGSGKGDNWWCVIYPPLCFIPSADNNAENIVYRSKILEIIENFFK